MTSTTTTHAPTTTSRDPGPAPTRLVLVEGLIGTGKSTVTAMVAEMLAERGVPVRSVSEGDPAHPGDLERVAVVDRRTLDRLRRDHPGWAPRLDAVVRPGPRSAGTDEPDDACARPSRHSSTRSPRPRPSRALRGISWGATPSSCDGHRPRERPTTGAPRLHAGPRAIG